MRSLKRTRPPPFQRKAGASKPFTVVPMNSAEKTVLPHVPIVNLTERHIARFFKFVPNKPQNGCWVWMGSLLNTGYGQLRIGGKQLTAHRVSWTIHHGPIPEGMCVLHRCDHPPCVRPDHLFLGTIADNNADKKAKGRSACGLKHGTVTHPNFRIGSKVWSAKLTEDQVLDIRRRGAMGEKQKNIAKEFNVKPTTICAILKTRSWKHVTPAP